MTGRCASRLGGGPHLSLTQEAEIKRVDMDQKREIPFMKL